MESFAEKVAFFLSRYHWLTDSYIIEFFSEELWDKLPNSWRKAFDSAPFSETSRFLLQLPIPQGQRSHVYPLSLLAFIATARSLSLPRSPLPPPLLSPPLPPPPVPAEKLENRSPEKCREEGEVKEVVREEMAPQEPVGKNAWEEEREAKTEAALGVGGGSETIGKEEASRNLSQVMELDRTFRFGVKLKKQHEIVLLSEVIMKLSEATGCKNIIDMGSGHGHLARYLAFHCGLQVTTVEANSTQLTSAAKLDSKAKEWLSKRKARDGNTADQEKERDGRKIGSSGSLRHTNILVQPNVSAESFLRQLEKGEEEEKEVHSQGQELPSDETRREGKKAEEGIDISVGSAAPLRKHYILVGLHTCGDLGPTMLSYFAQSRHVIGLASVGCCYMKITCSSSDRNCDPERKGKVQRENGHSSPSIDRPLCQAAASSAPNPTLPGYPLSLFVTSLLPSSFLSFEAREVACHAVEAYSQRVEENSENLRVHCHRAVVEVVLKRVGIRRGQLNLPKHVSKFPFESYIKSALKSAKVPLATVNMDELRALADQWEKVTLFFILRLLVAPCVETLVLLDRMLFLQEQANCSKVRLLPLFEPRVSPRNVIILAHK